MTKYKLDGKAFYVLDCKWRFATLWKFVGFVPESVKTESQAIAWYKNA